MGDHSPRNPRAVRMKHVIDGWLADHKTLASYAWFKAFLEDFAGAYGRVRVAN